MQTNLNIKSRVSERDFNHRHKLSNKNLMHELNEQLTNERDSRPNKSSEQQHQYKIDLTFYIKLETIFLNKELLKNLILLSFCNNDPFYTSDLNDHVHFISFKLE